MSTLPSHPREYMERLPLELEEELQRRIFLSGGDPCSVQVYTRQQREQNKKDVVEEWMKIFWNVFIPYNSSKAPKVRKNWGHRLAKTLLIDLVEEYAGRINTPEQFMGVLERMFSKTVLCEMIQDMQANDLYLERFNDELAEM